MTIQQRFKPLPTDMHLRTAAINQTPVFVFQGVELIGSGVITEIAGAVVKLRSSSETAYYMRKNCKFYTAV